MTDSRQFERGGLLEFEKIHPLDAVYDTLAEVARGIALEQALGRGGVISASRAPLIRCATTIEPCGARKSLRSESGTPWMPKSPCLGVTLVRAQFLWRPGQGVVHGVQWVDFLEFEQPSPLELTRINHLPRRSMVSKMFIAGGQTCCCGKLAPLRQLCPLSVAESRGMAEPARTPPFSSLDRRTTFAFPFTSVAALSSPSRDQEHQAAEAQTVDVRGFGRDHRRIVEAPELRAVVGPQLLRDGVIELRALRGASTL